MDLQIVSRLTKAILMVWAVGALPAASQTRHVVVLYDERTSLPGLSILDAGVSEALRAGSPERVAIYREEMDLSRFASPGYEGLLRDHLRTKYASKEIDVVIAVMGPALDFLLGEGATVFPATPIVFCGIDRREFGRRPLPPHVTGVLVKRRFAPTLDLALRLHPRTQRIVFVAGTSDFDRQLVRDARAELRAYEDRLAFRYLTEMSLADILAEVSELPPRTLVLFSTLFRDGAGESFVPHEVVELVSAAANAPVYGFVDQYLDHGIVGGRLYSLRTHGEEAARLALEILAGAAPSELPLAEPATGMTLLDWRQMRRWDIQESLLPPAAIVRFREPSLWNQHRSLVVGGAAVFALQALLIAALLLERSRRRRAESARLQAETSLRQRGAELSHFNRVVTIRGLTASVAHELNQPLGAIQSNAQAAEQFLSADPPALDEVREILADIRKDDQRAADIIRRMHSLLEKHELRPTRVRLVTVIEEILQLLEIEAAKSSVTLRFEPADGGVFVTVDRVHLQQVLMNLVLNGFEAMAAVPKGERHVTVRTELDGDASVQIAVADRGPGVPAEEMERLFEPFHTTKETGLGMGLTISREIIEAHEGRIWAENNADGGATFHVALPVPRQRAS